MSNFYRHLALFLSINWAFRVVLVSLTKIEVYVHSVWSDLGYLTICFAVLWNGRTHLKNLSANAAVFLKCV